MADAGQNSSLVVEELTGDKRRIELRGSGQPFRPAEWSVSQKVVTTWNQGNTQAVQHVMGPQDPPSEWEGAWHRTLLGRTPALLTESGGAPTSIVVPSDLRELFDDVCRKGQRLRVTWASTDGVGAQRAPIVREGILETFTYPHDRQDDINWKMKFSWAGRAGGGQRAIDTRQGDLTAYVNDVQAKADALTAKALRASLVSKNRQVAGSATAFSLGQLERLTQAPNDLLTSFTRSLTRVTSQFQQVAGIVRKTRSIPVQLENTALAFARNTVAIANQMQDQMGRRPPELNTRSAQLSDLTRSASYFWGTTDAASDVARSAQDLQDKTTPAHMRRGAQTAKTILAVHPVKDGDTLSKVAFKYYGTVDEAWRIAQANRLPWTTTTVFGVRLTLIIPVINTSQGSA